MFKAMTETCSVFGCKADKEVVSLHVLPKDLNIRMKWVHFIWKNRNIPTKLPDKTRVCSSHFPEASFENFIQKQMGFATKLILKPDAVPTIYPGEAAGSSQHGGPPSITALRSHTRDVGCQCDPPERPQRTVSTQLSHLTLIHRRSQAIQVKPSTKGFGVNTDVSAGFGGFLSTTIKEESPPLKRRRIDALSDGTEESEDTKPHPDDTSYHQSTSAVGESANVSHETLVQDATKYIVYEDCLLSLFHTCPRCGQTCEVHKFVRGTFLSVSQRCPFCQFNRKWNSQPIIGSTPAGNLHLSAAVNFTGSSFRQFNKVLSALKVRTIAETTYFDHARSYMDPCVFSTWKRLQADLIQTLSQREDVTLGGDMRAKIPGHNDKYGSYSVMDLHNGNIVDVQLMQSSEVGSSANMETEGLMRSLSFLESSGVTIKAVVTDRQPQIQKYLKEQKPDITHFYDMWHIAKGVSKKLEALAKEQKCDKVKKWQKCVIKHLYWSSTSSSSGEEAVAKWASISNHVQNIHSHDNALFPECQHSETSGGPSKKWLKPASKPAFKFQRIVKNKRLMRDVAKLSPTHQLSAIERFHGVFLQFAPKNLVFSYRGMLCRLCLAAIHFNENVTRGQLKTKDGALVYKIKCPKTKKGKCSIQAVKTKPTSGYVDNLLQVLFSEVLNDPGRFTAQLDQLTSPEPLCTQPKKSDREEAIAGILSRFSCPGEWSGKEEVPDEQEVQLSNPSSQDNSHIW
ncbi:uncharacterized protein LOC103357415 [Stegastes partitus]|uniref:Uncharacterized protein LOC103357415 n=1 Tax=Stegastes partitus TaxID=144197 RepID=A0A9Y4MT53_9TELE|nr:PREDICTED: uncharacterized protein LOC103357415 [Stegastes partitus]